MVQGKKNHPGEIIPHFWEGEGREFILCIQKLAEFT